MNISEKYYEYISDYAIYPSYKVPGKYHYWYREYIGRGTIYIGVDSEFIYKKPTLNTLVVAMQIYKQWYNDYRCSSTMGVHVPAK